MPLGISVRGTYNVSPLSKSVVMTRRQRKYVKSPHSYTTFFESIVELRMFTAK